VVDVRTDLYALGCILHLMLTAQPPFDAPTREQMIKRRLAEEPASVQTIDAGIPDVVANVVAKLLARSPENRYGSAAEVHDALAGHVARRSGFEVRAPIDNKYTPRSAPTVAFLNATQATTEVTEVPKAPLPQKRTRYVVGGLMVAGVAVVLLMNYPTPRAPSAEMANAVRDTTLDTMSVLTPPASAVDSMAAKTPVLPKTDSAALRRDSLRRVASAARIAKQRVDDSVTKATEALSSGARAVVGKYAQAFEAGSVSALKSVYPNMTQTQRDTYQKNFFERTDKIDAAVTYGDTKVIGDSAQVDFTIKLSMLNKATKQMEAPLALPPQRATLIRKSGGWQLVHVGGRN
jgi:hypothetical protein